MFNWTTTTIINSLEDLNGNPIVKVWDKETSVKDGIAGFSGQYPVLKIQHDYTFESRYISKIYKAKGAKPEMCEMTVDLKNIATLLGVNASNPVAHARLAFYINLEGSDESIYANSGYQKGKPFSVGFEVNNGESKTVIGERIAKNATKYGTIIYGKKVFDITNNEGVLTIKGTHEYQRFKKAAIALDNGIDEKVVAYYGLGEESVGDVFTIVKRGKNGFGTYKHLTKDLRLPTAENTRWLSILGDNRPAVGGLYTQYIINYCAPSMANPGLTMIGQHGMSATTHVFWVNDSLVDDFETALGDDFVNLIEDAEAKTTTDAGKVYSTNHERDIVDTVDTVTTEETAEETTEPQL